jgi:hypothetical protein
VKRLGIAAALVVLGVAAGARADSSCLQSGSGTVSITGQLVQKIEAGQVRWYVRLRASVCVSDAAAPPDAAEVVDARVVRLLVGPQRMDDDGYLIGRTVTARGYISTQQAPHQQAIVLLDVSSLEAAE